MLRPAVLEVAFWTAAAAIVYGYAGYPLLLVVLHRLRPAAPRLSGAWDPPSVSMIVPVHNESAVIADKLKNTQALNYPAPLQVLFISDGSTDATVDILKSASDSRIEVIALDTRGGKAAALNAGLAAARHDVLVFTDASIALAPDSLLEIVKPFRDPAIGCVSGEDRIDQVGGEGLYGRYELALRRMESGLHSIVGASGSFYAQRRALCRDFPAGLAPDFVSVLRTVEQGSRAVAEPRAVGLMVAVDDPAAEFGRKVRTILRGITTLAEYRHLLNPFRYGVFAFELLSHKVVRWLIPFFLMILALCSVALAGTAAVYLAALIGQILFYGSALLARYASRGFAQSLPGKVSLFFTSANVATAAAWVRFFLGHRQEIWTPSRR